MCVCTHTRVGCFFIAFIIITQVFEKVNTAYFLNGAFFTCDFSQIFHFLLTILHKRASLSLREGSFVLYVARIFAELKKKKRRIGVASGQSKVECICGAIRGKIINVLITDEETAGKVIERLE